MFMRGADDSCALIDLFFVSIWMTTNCLDGSGFEKRFFTEGFSDEH